MSLSAREHEALDRIAAGLADSDSTLAALLDTFTRLTAGEEMPKGEEVARAPRRVRRVRKLGGSSSAAWLPGVFILIVTAIIAVTAVLSGGAKTGACAQMQGLTCVSHVPASPSAQRPG